MSFHLGNQILNLGSRVVRLGHGLIPLHSRTPRRFFADLRNEARAAGFSAALTRNWILHPALFFVVHGRTRMERSRKTLQHLRRFQMTERGMRVA